MNKVSITTLGNLIEFQRGYDLPKSEFKFGYVPVISSNGILGYHNQAKVKGPGITIGRSGTVGLPHFINEDFFPHNTALYIKDFKGNFPRYIFYLLKTLSLNDRGSGSGVPTMNRNHLYPLKVSVHLDIGYQQKIASVLSALDSKIELNNRINAELEAMVKTIYDYWFVQFDFPDKNGKPYKTSGGKMVWNAELKREIPGGWEVKCLSELASLLARGISPIYIENDGIRILNQKCIRNKSIDFNLGRFHDINSKGVESKLIKIGDVLVNSTGVGTLGRVSIVKRLEINQTTVDSHVTIVRVDKKKANLVFIGYSLTEKQSEIEKLGDGSTGQTELSRENLGKLRFILPPENLQDAFEAFYNPQLQKMANNEIENQKLTELRDWLLPMLMNGQVKVS